MESQPGIETRRLCAFRSALRKFSVVNDDRLVFGGPGFEPSLGLNTAKQHGMAS